MPCCSCFSTLYLLVLGGQPLDESFWHVTEYYDNIRNKVKKLDKSLGECYKIEPNLPGRLCSTPMKVRRNMHAFVLYSYLLRSWLQHACCFNDYQGKDAVHT